MSVDTMTREATVEDAPALCALATALLPLMLSEATLAPPQWLRDSLAESAFVTRLKDTRYRAWVLERDGELVGYVALKRPDHLYHLFVSASCQRQGLARLLWQQMLTQCASPTVRVRASVPAVPVYCRLGFENAGELAEIQGITFQPMLWSRGGD